MADLQLQLKTLNGNVLGTVVIPDSVIPIVQAVDGGGTNQEAALAFLRRLLQLARPFYVASYEAINEAQEQQAISAARETARSAAETAFG